MSVADVAPVVALVVATASVAFVPLDVVLDDGAATRVVGRLALVAVGWLVRPARTAGRATVRWLREEPAATCRRVGHRPSWDGFAEWCRRCGVDSYPRLELDDPRGSTS